MDEVQDFCVRMLGPGEAAARAADDARRSGGRDAIAVLRAAVQACRQAGRGADGRGDAGEQATGSESDAGPAPTLADAVAGELARATACLPQRQREALALRERLGGSYDEIGAAIGIEPAAVAALLARARLRLRSELRGTEPPAGACDERERALRTIVRRRDGEDVPAADEDWLIEHLGHCPVCVQSHSAMLEASACYRAWRLPEVEAAAGGSAAAG
jgi:hypothetical protein